MYSRFDFDVSLILCRWNELRLLLDTSREALSQAIGINQFQSECNETEEWIKEKARLLANTGQAPLKDCDLDAVVSLQRKLSSMERELAAIQVHNKHCMTVYAYHTFALCENA